MTMFPEIAGAGPGSAPGGRATTVRRGQSPVASRQTNGATRRQSRALKPALFLASSFRGGNSRAADVIVHVDVHVLVAVGDYPCLVRILQNKIA